MVSKTQVDWLSAHIEQIALANDPAIHLTTSSINRAETMVEATATKQAAASTKVPAAFEAGESPTQNITPARANETTIMDKLGRNLQCGLGRGESLRSRPAPW